MPQTTSLPRPSDRWIPWYFVGFFILLTAVLVPMCVIAVRTNTGVTTDGAYEKGLAYNKDIAAEQRQTELGWKGNISIRPSSDNRIKADFTLKNKSNQPLAGATVKIWLVRPTQAGKDQTASMTEQSEGLYTADLTLPERGLWEVRVSATQNGQNFQMIQRVVVP